MLQLHALTGEDLHAAVMAKKATFWSQTGGDADNFLKY